MVKPKSHEANRYVLCALCASKKGELRKITEAQKQTITTHFISDFIRLVANYPAVICGTCRIVCTEYAVGNFERSIKLYNFLHTSSTVTRLNPKCCCEICVIARAGINKIKPSKLPRGRPRIKENKAKETKRMCTGCFSNIGQGKIHFCTISERVRNLTGLLDNDSSASRAGEAAVSSFIHKKIVETKNLTIQLRNRRGKPSVFQKHR